MRLIELAEIYLSERLVSASHSQDIRAVCRRADQAVGETISGPAIAEWLRSQLAHRSPATVARYRRILRAVLAYGAERGLCPVIRLPQVRVPRPVPQAWTLQEVERLLETAARWPGLVGHAPARLWWTALILTVYWTGARIGSILAATPMDWDGTYLYVRQSKTGKATMYRLHPQAAAAIERIYDRRLPRLFYWPHSRHYLYRVFSRIVRQAGIGCVGRGLFHRLRRTCITYCWAVDPGVAVRQAGHSDGRVTLRHYVDPRLVDVGPQAADVLPVPRVRNGDGQLMLFPWG